MKEFDRILGGGLIVGSAVLVGGTPGIGKSTLLLQVCQYISQKGYTTLLCYSGRVRSSNQTSG